MPRLTEHDALALASVLSGATADVRDDRLSTDEGRSAAQNGDESASRLRSVFADSESLDELGRSITLDLASYLNRPVRCSVIKSTPLVTDVWRFEAAGPGFHWWLDFDVELACAFADAMIGGDGTGHMGHGRRVRALVERVVMRMFGTIAGAARIEAPSKTSASPADAGPVIVLAGGLCAVATDQFAWQIGMRVTAPIAHEALVREPPRLLNAVATSVATSEAHPAGPHPPQAAVDPDAVIRAAIDAFRAHLEEVLHCRIAATEPSISTLAGTDVASMPRTSLGLALTAGGDGALVVFLNGDAIAGLSAGAVGAPIPMADPPGEVVLAAAEAIVRDALADAARRLPGIASDVHRIVRLTDNSLPARTPHHAVDVRFTVGGRSGALQMLVPSWMLSQAGS